MSYEFEGADGKTYGIPVMTELSGFATEQLETKTLPVLMAVIESGQHKDEEGKREILSKISPSEVFKFFRIVLGEETEAYRALMELKTPEIFAVFSAWLQASRADKAPLSNA